MSNKQQLTQISIPFATTDSRLEGLASLSTDKLIVYKNVKGLSVNYKGIYLEKYLTYKRKEVDLGEYGNIIVYLQATFPIDSVQSELIRMLRSNQFIDINHLIEIYNNFEILS